MIKYITATKNDINLLVNSRLEMLKVVNDLPPDYVFDEEFIANSREYFLNPNQTTVLAIDDKVVGCATMCYITIMPTFSHPTGKRAHLMNVYTNDEYRRQGLASKMVNMLIDEAREKGVTEISLDTTELGRTLYKSCGFIESEECMVLELKQDKIFSNN